MADPGFPFGREELSVFPENPRRSGAIWSIGTPPESVSYVASCPVIKEPGPFLPPVVHGNCSCPWLLLVSMVTQMQSVKKDVLDYARSKFCSPYLPTMGVPITIERKVFVEKSTQSNFKKTARNPNSFYGLISLKNISIGLKLGVQNLLLII